MSLSVGLGVTGKVHRLALVAEEAQQRLGERVPEDAVALIANTHDEHSNRK